MDLGLAPYPLASAPRRLGNRRRYCLARLETNASGRKLFTDSAAHPRDGRRRSWEGGVQLHRTVKGQGPQTLVYLP